MNFRLISHVKKWIHVSPEEMGLFWGAAILIFFIRCAALVFNNFAETVFLKRFGVAWLPVLYIVNPVVTLVLLGVVARLSPRISAWRRLLVLQVGCVLMAVALWGTLFLEPRGLYPVLLVLKVQFETLLSVLFWNLGNELFNFHQSKRLFPLITVGGVLGDMGGNLLTVALSGVLPINHLVLVYAALLSATVLVTRYLSDRFPLAVVPGASPEPKKKKKKSVVHFPGIYPFLKKFPLVAVLVGLTFFANVVLPIMNYQFNVAVDRGFAGESEMILFFGGFRGAMNGVSLLLLFFSGKVYDRWGIPGGLLFHPVNYLLVFLAFLFRFDLVSAMYARFSTNVIRTTFNQPVNNMLIGIFPDAYRSRIRPFLRGMVARAGLITGSCLILLTTTVLPVHYLSLVALPFVCGWVATVAFLKFRYSSLIIGLLSSDTMDLKTTESHVVRKMFREPAIQERLLENLKKSRGPDAFFHARLLHYLGVEHLDHHILDILPHQDSRTVRQLLPLISGTGGDRIFQVLQSMIDVADTPLTLAMIRTVKPRNRKACREFYRAVEVQCRRHRSSPTCVSHEIQAYSAACQLMQSPGNQTEVIQEWRHATQPDRVHAAIIVAGASKRQIHVPWLLYLLSNETPETLLPAVIRALHQLGFDDGTGRLRPFLSHPLPEVRRAALEALVLTDDVDLRRRVLSLVGDTDDQVRGLAIEKIKNCPYCNGRLLFECLHPASARMRDGIFEILKALEIKEPDLFAFFEEELRRAGICLSVSQCLSDAPVSLSRDLLLQHLSELGMGHVQTALQVASIKDDSGQVRVLLRSLFSGDDRLRANGLEAMESTIHPRLVKRLMPFLDGRPPEKILESVGKRLRVPDFRDRVPGALDFLLKNGNILSVRLAREILLSLPVARDREAAGEDRESLPIVSARRSPGAPGTSAVARSTDMKEPLSFQEKIVYIQKVDIFKNLAVNELAAISDIAREVFFSPGEVLFHEKEFADSMYICVEGELVGSRNQVDVGHFTAGDSFGMSAFLVDSRRLLTCTALVSTRLLEIHKQEFEAMLMEYPQIPYEIAKIHARMIQRLLEQIRAGGEHEHLVKGFFNKADLL